MTLAQHGRRGRRTFLLRATGQMPPKAWRNLGIAIGAACARHARFDQQLMISDAAMHFH
jgi:hypothetical protein